MEGRDGEAKIRFYKNHLLFEFKVRTVSYRPSFFPHGFIAWARSLSEREKTGFRNLQGGTRKGS